jgi:sec-independent protein translocase protein TatC
VSDPNKPNSPNDSQDEGGNETFISHLVELRDRIVRAAIAVIVVFV